MSAHASAYVQYVDEDPAYELVAIVKRLVDPASAGSLETELNALIDQQSYAPLLQRIATVLASSAATASVEDFDLAYNMFFAQMERTEITVAQRSVLVPTLLSQLTAQPSTHAASKVKLLISLFNLLASTDAQRADALSCAMENALTGSADLVSLISARTLTVERFDAWRAQWSPALTAAAWQRLLLAAAGILNAQRSSSARLFWVRALQTADVAASVVVNALVAALTETHSIAVDEFLSIASVQAAEKTEAGALVKLVRLLSSGSLSDALACIQQNSKYFESVGLTAAALSERARLTAMCQLFQQQAAWPLATLAQQLSLSAAWDAERLVVRAASLGLVGAKIDQETDIVSVEQTAARQVAAVDWKQLRDHVKAWQQSVDSVLSAFENAKQSAPLQRA